MRTRIVPWHRVVLTFVVGTALALALIVTRTTSPQENSGPRSLDGVTLLADVPTSFHSFIANSQPATMSFGGRILAGNSDCLQNRVIQIWRDSGGSTLDVLVHTTSTTGFSMGQFSTIGMPKVVGTYYAIATEQDTLDGEDTCLAATSDPDEVT